MLSDSSKVRLVGAVFFSVFCILLIIFYFLDHNEFIFLSNYGKEIILGKRLQKMDFSSENTPDTSVSEVFIRTLDSFFNALLPLELDCRSKDHFVVPDHGAESAEEDRVRGLAHRTSRSGLLSFDWFERFLYFTSKYNPYLAPCMYGLCASITSLSLKDSNSSEIIHELYVDQCVRRPRTSDVESGRRPDGRTEPVVDIVRSKVRPHHYPRSFPFINSILRLAVLLCLVVVVIVFVYGMNDCSTKNDELGCIKAKNYYEEKFLPFHVFLKKNNTNIEYSQYSSCIWRNNEVSCSRKDSYNYYSEHGQILALIEIIFVISMFATPFHIIVNMIYKQAIQVIDYWELIADDLRGMALRINRYKYEYYRGRDGGEKENGVEFNEVTWMNMVQNLESADEMDFYDAKGLLSDELGDFQTYKSRVMRAARVTFLLENFDKNSAKIEIKDLLQRARDGSFSLFIGKIFEAVLYFSYLSHIWSLACICVRIAVWLDMIEGIILQTRLYLAQKFRMMKNILPKFITDTGLNLLQHVDHHLLFYPMSSCEYAAKFLHHAVQSSGMTKFYSIGENSFVSYWQCPLVEQGIENCRVVSSEMCLKINHIHQDIHRDIYLLRRFMFSSLVSTFERRLALRYFYHSDMDRSFSFLSDNSYSTPIGALRNPSYYQYPYIIPLLCCVLLFIFFGGVVYCIFWYAPINLDNELVWLYMLIAILAVVIDIFVILPFSIFINWVVIPSNVSWRLHVIRERLYLKYRHVLGRTKGVMKSDWLNSLLQHFNPVCRAARRFPNLNVGKFLISLNDYDMVAPKVRVSKSYVTGSFSFLNGAKDLFLWPLRKIIRIILNVWILIPSYLIQDIFLDFSVVIVSFSVAWGFVFAMDYPPMSMANDWYLFPIVAPFAIVVMLCLFDLQFFYEYFRMLYMKVLKFDNPGVVAPLSGKFNMDSSTLQGSVLDDIFLRRYTRDGLQTMYLTSKENDEIRKMKVIDRLERQKRLDGKDADALKKMIGVEEAADVVSFLSSAVKSKKAATRASAESYKMSIIPEDASVSADNSIVNSVDSAPSSVESKFDDAALSVPVNVQELNDFQVEDGDVNYEMNSITPVKILPKPKSKSLRNERIVGVEQSSQQLVADDEISVLSDISDQKKSQAHSVDGYVQLPPIIRGEAIPMLFNNADDGNDDVSVNSGYSSSRQQSRMHSIARRQRSTSSPYGGMFDSPGFRGGSFKSSPSRGEAKPLTADGMMSPWQLPSLNAGQNMPMDSNLATQWLPNLSPGQNMPMETILATQWQQIMVQQQLMMQQQQMIQDSLASINSQRQMSAPRGVQRFIGSNLKYMDDDISVSNNSFTSHKA